MIRFTFNAAVVVGMAYAIAYGLASIWVWFAYVQNLNGIGG